MRAAKTDPPVWVFQYRLKWFKRLEEEGLELNPTEEPWEANRSRHLMRPGQQVYFLRASSDHAPSAAIVAVGHIKSEKPYPHGCSRPDCEMVDVVFDALVTPPLAREVMRRDPVLGSSYLLARGLTGTNFHLDKQIAQRLGELLDGNLGRFGTGRFPMIPEPPDRMSLKQYSPSDLPVLDESETLTFEVDPEKVAQARRNHESIIDRLAQLLYAQGITPLIAKSAGRRPDLVFMVGDTAFVTEVKSMTSANQEPQLRHGLAQALIYRHLYSGPFHDVRAVLVTEDEPSDGLWKEICDSLDVILLWPSTMEQEIALIARGSLSS